MSDQFPNTDHPIKLEDLIPGIAPLHHITIISGDSYVGKTRLAFCMAEALANGLPFFWDALPPLRVGYFSERSASSVIRQIADQDLHLDEVTFITLLDMAEPVVDAYIKNTMIWLSTILAKHQFDVIFLDTFAHFLPSYARASGSMNDYSTMMRATIELQRISLHHKVTPFCLYHNAKERTGAEYKTHKTRVSGSAAISANTLALWSISEQDGSLDFVEDSPVAYRKLEIAYHHGKDQILYFRTLPNGRLVPIDKQSMMEPPEKRTKPLAAFRLIPSTGISRATFAEQVQVELNVGRTRAQNIIKDLIDSNRVVQDETKSILYPRPSAPQ